MRQEQCLISDLLAPLQARIIELGASPLSDNLTMWCPVFTVLSACQKKSSTVSFPAAPRVMPSIITTETAPTWKNFWMPFFGDRQLTDYNQVHLTFLSDFLSQRLHPDRMPHKQSKFNPVRSDIFVVIEDCGSVDSMALGNRWQLKLSFLKGESVEISYSNCASEEPLKSQFSGVMSSLSHFSHFFGSSIFLQSQNCMFLTWDSRCGSHQPFPTPGKSQIFFFNICLSHINSNNMLAKTWTKTQIPPNSNLTFYSKISYDDNLLQWTFNGLI